VVVAFAPALGSGQQVVDEKVAEALGLVAFPVGHAPLELLLRRRILLGARRLIDLVGDALDREQAERERVMVCVVRVVGCLDERLRRVE